ncbi:MAG: PQQ-binding-like beta-propeller repeat protein [Thermomicrobiales bacterium]
MASRSGRRHCRRRQPHGLNVFDRASGERLWSVPFDPDSGNPVLVDGTIYITGLGGAFAFDAATGEQRWQFDPGLEPATEDWMSPSTTLAGDPLVIGDTVYVSGGSGEVYALDAATGEETWRIETVGSSPGTLSSTDEGLVFGPMVFAVSGSSGESALRAVDLATGASLWETSLGPDVFSPAPISRHRGWRCFGECLRYGGGPNSGACI